MKASLAQTGAKIVVAVQFDDLSTELLKAADSLAKKISGSVHAVHVCEPTNPIAWSYATGGGFGLENVALMIEEQQLDAAKGKMKDLMKHIDPAGKYSSQILTGNPAQMVSAEAMARGAALIVTGASPGSHRFIPKGLSTALSLMGHSDIPVMVMTKDSKFDLEHQPFRILVADDLRENSVPALRLVVALSKIAANSEILQVHVNGLTRETLTSGLETAAATSHSAPITSATAEEVFSIMMKNIESKMEDRLRAAAGTMPAKAVAAKKMVCTGSVTDELQKVLGTFPADVVVYGRHQTFHHKPFSVGQVPFYSVLALRRPVIVAPADA